VIFAVTGRFKNSTRPSTIQYLINSVSTKHAYLSRTKGTRRFGVFSTGPFRFLLFLALLLRLLLLAVVAAAPWPLHKQCDCGTQQTNRPRDVAERRRGRAGPEERPPSGQESSTLVWPGPQPPPLGTLPSPRLLLRHPLCVTDCLLMFAFATLLHKFIFRHISMMFRFFVRLPR